jgi:putative DNA primase/helicase
MTDFARTAAAALAAFDHVMTALGLTDGKRSGPEFLPLNPRRADSKPGSFSINSTTGAWADFATGDAGGDLVALAAYCRNEAQGEAARWLSGLLGLGDAPSSPAPAAAPRRDAGSTWLDRVPDDAPPPPVAHHRNGRPSQVWEYRLADGALSLCVWRFDQRGERKSYSPVTLWRTPSGLRWLFKWPEGATTMLYGLPALARLPDAPVVLCEGEKAADAAAILFPDRPCLSWLGGVQNLKRADLAPLAAREVWLWPDNDKPGSDAMGAAAARLIDLGAKVFLIDLKTFAQMASTDALGNATLHGSAPMDAGDDAFDLVARGWTAAHMRLAEAVPGFVQRCGVARVPAPARATPPSGGRFEMDSEGLWRNTDSGRMFVCRGFEVLALARDPAGQGWGLLVALTDPDGRDHRFVVPFVSLSGQGGDALALFLDHGLVPTRGRDGLLVEFLRGVDTPARARVASKSGWHGGVFVLPGRVFGASAGEVWVTDALARPEVFGSRGTLDDWSREVGSLCAGNTRLLFACAIAFAGPILDALGLDSGGFLYRGSSSTGKTTLLRIGVSVCGAPDFMERLRATDNALEAVAAARNDLAGFFDELGQLDPAAAGQVAYMLANGSAKARASRTGAARERLQWRLIFLVASEVGLAAHMSEAGHTARAGQLARLVDLPADAGRGLGCFETIHGRPDAHAFAQELVAAAARCHGAPLHAWLERLVEARRDPSFADELARRLKKMEGYFATPSAGGQARRVAQRFALIALAGELAREWLALPWQPGEVRDACVALFESWTAARGGQGDLETKQMIGQVRDFLSRHGESRFSDWDRPGIDADTRAPRTLNRAGVRRLVKGNGGADYSDVANGEAIGGATDDRVEYFVFPAVFAGEICKGHDPAVVARELLRIGALVPGSDGRSSRSLTVPMEGKRRVYHLRAEALWASE